MFLHIKENWGEMNETNLYKIGICVPTFKVWREEATHTEACLTGYFDPKFSEHLEMFAKEVSPT